MASKLDGVLRKKLWRCYAGWFAWKRIMLKTHTSRHGRDRKVVILLSSNNHEYNYYGLLYLPAFMQINNYSKAVVVGFDRDAISSAKLFSNKISDAVLVSKKIMGRIIDLYTLYKFRKHVVIVDLERPNGRNGRALLGKRGITVEDMISVGVYNLYPVRRPSGPMYGGDDPAILRFLTINN